MKLTRDAAFKLYKTIETFDSKQYNKYFLYAIFSNKKILIPVVEEIVERSKTSVTPDFKEFQDKYNSLKSDDVEELSKLRQELVELYSDALKETNELGIQFNNWVNEEIELDLKTISFEHIPEQIDIKIYDALSVIFLDP